MIACIDWGSRIWQPRTPPISEWQTDGPSVNVEFVRQSKGKRLTLVRYYDAESMPSLWARMCVTEDDMDAVVIALKSISDAGLAMMRIHRT